jgi:hypothetical protein
LAGAASADRADVVASVAEGGVDVVVDEGGWEQPRNTNGRKMKGRIGFSVQ